MYLGERFPKPAARNSEDGSSVPTPRRNALLGWPAMSEATPETEARRLATEARDRVRFEEDALALADQVYRVARHLVGSREEADYFLYNRLEESTPDASDEERVVEMLSQDSVVSDLSAVQHDSRAVVVL